MDSNKIIALENKKAQIEEVREIESEKETKLETPTVEKKETSVEKSSNEELTDKDKRNKKNTEETIGGALTASCANPVAGAAATGVTGMLGGVAGLIGEATDNDTLKVAGDTYVESAKKPAENIGRGVERVVGGIKKIFE